METMTKLEREQAQKLIEMDVALDRLWNLNNDLCNQIESGTKTIAQLRDELATVKAKYDAADEALCCIAKTVNDTDIYVIESIDDDVAKVVRELKQRAERAESELRESKSKVLAMCTEVNGKLANERDELKAKLEHPRMIMRDGGQLWEVFEIDGHTIGNDQWQYYELGVGWCKCDTKCLWLPEYLYRRPITPQELQGWIEPQPQGEVLFRGVRNFDIESLHRLWLGSVPFNTPVHVTIRKAGE